MLYYLRQNKHLIAASLTLFIISLSALMFFVSANHELEPQEYHASAFLQHGKESRYFQEGKYRALADNEEDSLVVLTPDAHINFFSLDFGVLVGRSLEELREKPFSSILHSEDEKVFHEGFSKAVRLQKTINVIGPYRLKGDNTAYQVHIGTAIPVLENHKVVEVIVVSHEIDTSPDGTEEGENKALKKNDLRLMAEKLWR